LSYATPLKKADCTALAMEATGVYWKPVHNLLEGHFDLVVATEVGLTQVELVLSLEAYRLSRKNSDWCHLLELARSSVS
jgi:hypothetical protein